MLLYRFLLWSGKIPKIRLLDCCKKWWAKGGERHVGEITEPMFRYVCYMRYSCDSAAPNYTRRLIERAQWRKLAIEPPDHYLLNVTSCSNNSASLYALPIPHSAILGLDTLLYFNLT